MVFPWIQRLLVWGSLILMSTPGAWADRFQLRQQPLLIPERGEVTSCVIVMETNQVVFLPPADWLVRTGAAEKKVTMRSPDGAILFSLKFVEAATNGTPKLEAEAISQQVKERFPRATVVGQYTCYSGVGSGLAFDLEQTGAQREKIHTRIAFVPMPGYLLEFNATAINSPLKQWEFHYGNLLAALRVDPVLEKQP